MSTMSKNYNHRIEQKFVVKHFIDQLHETLENEALELFIQNEEEQDQEVDAEDLDQNALSVLFPNQDATELLMQAMRQIAIGDYLETVKDKRFPDKSERRVFVKTIADQLLAVSVRLESDLAHVFVEVSVIEESDVAEADFPFKKVKS